MQFFSALRNTHSQFGFYARHNFFQNGRLIHEFLFIYTLSILAFLSSEIVMFFKVVSNLEFRMQIFKASMLSTLENLMRSNISDSHFLLHCVVSIVTAMFLPLSSTTFFICTFCRCVTLCGCVLRTDGLFVCFRAKPKRRA